MTAFRDQVIAALMRDEYPLLGAVTVDAPDGIDASVWHDGWQVMCWVTCSETWTEADAAVTLLSDRLFEMRANPTGQYLMLDVCGVVCVPDGAMFLPLVEYADKQGIAVWMFDGQVFKELDVDEGGEA